MEENKMGTVPVSRLVISMGLPLMLSLLISSLYNFVDSVFVARVSECPRNHGVQTNGVAETER